MQYAGKNDMQVTVFDFLRYFKTPLMYMKTQLMTQDGTKFESYDRLLHNGRIDE